MNMINSSNFCTNQTHSYNLQAKKKKNQKTSLIAFALDKTHFTDSIHQTFN